VVPDEISFENQRTMHHELQNREINMINPRYIALSLLATLFVAAGLLGMFSERLELQDLLGSYQGKLLSIGMELIVIGIAVGALNLILTLRGRRNATR